MSVFQAVWPVVDDSFTEDQLKAEAVKDLPHVARRHGVITVGKPTVKIMQGRDVPGISHAAWCVVAESPVAEFGPPPSFDRPCDVRRCARCGIDRQSSRPSDYCQACKPLARADGWL